MIKFFNKYRKIIFIVVIAIVLIMMAIVIKQFLYPDDLKSIYGSRLDGIEEVEITSNKKISVINEIKTDENVEDASINIKGKIIKIILKGKEGLTIEKSKEILSNTLNKFSDKEKQFYDFEFFATNTHLKYYVIGSKSKMIENIVWTEYSEVDENEES
jgi:hypothetical protein